MLKRRRDQGMTLLAATVIFIIIGGISAAFFILSLNEAKSTESNRYRTRASYLAEAGAEIAANSLRQTIANNPAIMMDPAKGGTALNTLVVNQVVLIDGFPVQCKAMKRQILVISPPPPASALVQNKATFEIMGYASVGGNPSKTKDKASQQATVYKMVETTGTPILQFLAFYNGDMEVNPGPYAHFHGRMHTNGDMFLTDRDTSKGMVLDTDHVQAFGNMYRSYSNKAAAGAFAATAVETGATGDVWVRKQGTTPLSDATIDANPANDPGLVNWSLGLQSGTGFGSTAMSNWNGTVLDKSMGAQQMVPPTLQSIQPGGYYDLNASLSIRNGVAMQGGTDVTSLINAQQANTITSSTIWDAREGKNMPVVTIDMGKLMQTSYAPKILYATDSNATANPSTMASGVQLINGSYIGGTSGVTVASNLPVYVKGDYNGFTDPTTGLSIPAINGIPQTQNASGNVVPTVPCAIMADAVNLLSNKWDGTKSSTSGVPAASNTTYNTAIVAGNQATVADPTNPNDHGYNGGLQNLPRFHEDWSGGVKCNIAGSFVNLWRSQIATGVYGQSGVYSPPERHWDFDQQFSSAFPPGIPYAISIGRTTYEEGAARGDTPDSTGLVPLKVSGQYVPYDLLPD